MKKHLYRVIPALVLMLGILAALYNFVRENSAQIAKQNEKYITDFTSQRAVSIDTAFEENLTFIQSIAYLYGKSLKSPEADIDLIEDYEKNSCFEMLRFVDAKGDDYTSKGLHGNLADREYFQTGMKGESGITYVMKSRVTGQRQAGFYAPVYYKNEIIGVMVGFFGEDYLRKLVEFDLLGYEGEGWLIAGNGDVIGSTRHFMPENYYDYLRDERITSKDERIRLREALKEGVSTAFTCTEDNEEVTCYAVCLESCDWTLIRNFPASASKQMLKGAISEGQKLVFFLVILFIAFTAFIAIRTILEKRRMREAGQDASDISTGVSKLFDRFVAIDLKQETYHYIEGEPFAEELPTLGSYKAYQEAIYKRIADEGEKRDAKAFLDTNHLKTALYYSDTVSTRIHLPVNADEWFTFNFIVIERANNLPIRLLLVVQDVTDLYKKEQKEEESKEQS